MDPSVIQQLLQLIKEEWQALPVLSKRGQPWSKPWGVWITLHAPLPADADMISQPAHSVWRAWFLQAGPDQPQERNIWEFIRFWVMHFERPWDKERLAGTDPRFSIQPYYALGLASFAGYENSQDIYLGTIWAGLWGLGRRLTINAQGQLEPVKGLWMA